MKNVLRGRFADSFSSLIRQLKQTAKDIALFFILHSLLNPISLHRSILAPSLVGRVGVGLSSFPLRGNKKGAFLYKYFAPKGAFTIITILTLFFAFAGKDASANRLQNNRLLISNEHNPIPAKFNGTTSLFDFAQLTSAFSAPAVAITSTATGGDWSNAATWKNGIVPGAGDDVIIANGATVTIDTHTPALGSLTIGLGTSGILQYDAIAERTVTVSGIVTINSGGTFRSAPPTTAGTINDNLLVVGVSLINNGTLDFCINSSGAGIKFIGTTTGNSMFNCEGSAKTNLKETNGVLLEMDNPGKTLLFYPGADFKVCSTTAKGFLTIVSGIFKLASNAIPFSNPVFSSASYTIPAAGGFELSNANATITGQDGTVTNQGKIIVSAGTYNIGTATGNSSLTSSDGTFAQSGGTINIAGRFKISGGNCNISGGTMNIATIGYADAREAAFHIAKEANLNMVGSPLITFTYPHSNTVPFNDIYIESGKLKSIAGGTFQMGTSATPELSTFFVNSEIPLDRITVFNECAIRVVNTSEGRMANTVNGTFDKVALMLSPPESITVICNTVLPAAYTNLQAFTDAGGKAMYNCTLVAASFKFVGQTQSGTSCPYTITRTYQATDIFGSSGTAQHLIFVEDEATEPPLEAVVEPAEEEVVKLKSAMAAITSTTTGGDWNVGTSWVGGVVPGAGDDVTIVSGATITLTSDAQCNNITNEGTLNYFNNGAFTLQVNGNWTNNGTYSGGTNGIVEFAGASNAIISGTTNFEELKITKGSLNTTLTVSGTTTVTSGGSLLLTSGLVTIPVGGSFTVNPASAISIPAIAGFDVTGGSLTTGNFTITNAGLIRVSSGTANFGTNSGNSVHTQFDGAFIVSGGNVNIAGRLENSASGTLTPPGVTSGINISGGTVTLSTVGNGLSNVGTLNVTSAGTFNFTGGTLVFQNKSTATTALDLGLIGGTGAKTTIGGTFQFGNASTPVGTVFNISSNVPLNSLTSSANADIKLADNVTIGQLALNSGTTIDLNGKKIQLYVLATGTTYTFPLDNGSGAAIPVTVNLTSGTIASGAYIQIETTATKHLDNASSTNYLNRYWTVTTSGITSPVYDVTATYADVDIIGTETEIAMGNWTGAIPWIKGNVVNDVANTVTKTGITSTSFVFAGITSDPPTVTASANPAAICLGSSANLTATPSGDAPFSYSWSPVTALSATDISNPVATPTATTTYTVTVTDGNGFTATASVTVTVNPLPTITLGTPSIFCPNAASFTLPYSSSTGTPTTYSISAGTPAVSGFVPVVDAAFTGSPLTISLPAVVLANTYQFNITVKNGNGCVSTNQTFNVTFEDITLPTISCPANIAENVTPGTCGRVVNYTAPVGTDNCSGATTIQTAGLASGQTFPVGITINTFEVTDASGNKTSCSFTVTIIDNGNPVVSCPANITENVTPGTCGRVVNYTTPVGTDNCSGATTLQTAGLGSGATFPLGTTTNTFEVTDASGNTASCSFTVTIIDNQNPTITCPANVSVAADAGICTASGVALGTPTTADNCTVASVTNNAPATFPIGNTTVTWTVTDGSGNTATCNQTVTVTDNQNPTITCPANVSVTADAGICTASAVALGTPTTADNCTVASVTNNAPATFPNGNTTVVWTVTDGSGNTATCNQIVTVTDNEVPVITNCPTDITVNTGIGRLTCNQVASWTTPAATDNCTATGSLVWTNTHSPGATFPVGTTIVTYTVKDAANNTTTCTFNVTVVDNTPPTFTAPGPISINSTGTCSFDASTGFTGLPSALADNCTLPVAPISYTDVQNDNVPPACKYPFTITRTWKLTDSSGNITTHDQTITVRDVTPPQITSMPANKTVECNTNYDPVNPSDFPTATDCSAVTFTYVDNLTAGNCAGKATVIRRWRATDCSGNFTEANQTIEINDTQAPVVTFPAGLRLEEQVACPANIPSDNDFISRVIASDNCGTVTVEFINVVYHGLGNKPGYCPEALTRYYRVRDNCNNSVIVEHFIDVLEECQCSYCVNTPFEYANLETTPVWYSMDRERGGKDSNCCPTADDNCISFFVYLGKDQVGFRFSIESGAIPSGSLYYKINCQGTGLPVGVGKCLAGDAWYTITFCKPGGNKNVYKIEAINGVTEVGELTTRVDCQSNLEVTGVIENTVTWTDLSGNGYERYLSPSTASLTPTFFVPEAEKDIVPPFIDFEVCGILTGATDCGEAFEDCKTVRVTILPKIEINLTIETDKICEGHMPSITPIIDPPDNDYEFHWYNSLVEEILSVGSTFTPPAEGDYFVKVVKLDGILVCNESDLLPFTVAYDKTGPALIDPPPPLALNLNCSDTDKLQQVSDWLALFKATYSGSDGIPVTVVMTPTYGSINDVSCGIIPVNFKAVDQCGNLLEITNAEIRIADTQAPVITSCPAAATGTADSNECFTISLNLGSATATDNCGNVTISNNLLTLFPSGEIPVGVHAITWTATDECNNSSTCNQTVTVTDNSQPPTITCPGPVVQTSGPNQCFLNNVVIPIPTYDDNCTVTKLTWSYQDPDGDPHSSPDTGINFVGGQTFETGVTTVTYTAYDAAGYNTACTFTVTIIPFNPPVFTAGCPANVGPVPVDAGLCLANVTVPAPNITDLCSVGYTVTNSFNGTANASGNYPIGTTTVIWTITPTLGAITICTQTVTVVDTQNPTITCPASFTKQTDPTKLYATLVNIPIPTNIDDNCSYTLTWALSGPNLTDASTNTTGESFVPSPYPQLNLGDNIITYTIDDGHDNVVTCSFTITVLGIPEIECPADISDTTDPNLCTATLDPGVPTLKLDSPPADSWKWVMTGATIDPGITSSGASPTPIGNYAFNPGVTYITWTASNVSGSSLPCTQTITVTDNQPPTFDASDKEYCVSNIISATFNGLPEPNADIIEPRPDWYIAYPSLKELDITNLGDNCCDPDDLIISWTITFNDGVHSPISGNKQPSEYDPDNDGFPNPITLWGATDYSDIQHTITYTLTDCKSPPNTTEKTQTITIKPRPNVVKVP